MYFTISVTLETFDIKLAFSMGIILMPSGWFNTEITPSNMIKGNDTKTTTTTTSEFFIFLT